MHAQVWHLSQMCINFDFFFMALSLFLCSYLTYLIFSCLHYWVCDCLSCVSIVIVFHDWASITYVCFHILLPYVVLDCMCSTLFILYVFFVTWDWINSSGFKDFLLKPELPRAIVDSGFEHPSKGIYNSILNLPLSLLLYLALHMFTTCFGFLFVSQNVTFLSNDIFFYLLSTFYWLFFWNRDIKNTPSRNPYQTNC